MPIGIIGKKIGMSQIFDDSGKLIPVTLIEAGPCPILQVKTAELDGYAAIQLGFDALEARKGNPNRKRSGLTKPELGHVAKSGQAPHRVIREVRLDDVEGDYEVGQTLTTEVFAEGEKVDVTGFTKGRGTAGTIKRHGTSRGPESHGSMYHRRVGSAGGASDPARTFPGKKMPGRYGNSRKTVLNLRVVKTDPEKNLLFVRGAVPGHNNAYVLIRKATKVKAAKKNRGATKG